MEIVFDSHHILYSSHIMKWMSGHDIREQTRDKRNTTQLKRSHFQRKTSCPSVGFEPTTFIILDGCFDQLSYMYIQGSSAG